jgi:hypothetical protein
MQPLKDAWRRIMPRLKPRVPQPEQTTPEQMKEVIDLAEEFDRLQGLPVWEKIVRQMGMEVQTELIEATKFKYEPVRQVAHTTRWDAKRELLDNVLGWIESTQGERDRIIAEFKENQQWAGHQ